MDEKEVVGMELDEGVELQRKKSRQQSRRCSSMGVYNVHGGHNHIVPRSQGGFWMKTTEDRKVTARVISALRAAGHTVYDCTDDSGRTQGQNLANIVAKCNAHPVDLNISNHLNAGGGTGVEVWCYDEKTKDIAVAICASVSSALGIPKQRCRNILKICM